MRLHLVAMLCAFAVLLRVDALPASEPNHPILPPGPETQPQPPSPNNPRITEPCTKKPHC
ncbi:hypothetical protein MJO28_001461 [Puccinia striiformis f. sp. tritici]|uniref:Uncharacterized protein n=1 Tax=Puccinia striiformis f. sp. tritici TaxID=168172 RepID=A0ACC0EUE9_9BASI|nr:hypothetical protein MJO28_001461 [Puccinia striiformis f. sp. tritici]